MKELVKRFLINFWTIYSNLCPIIANPIQYQCQRVFMTHQSLKSNYKDVNLWITFIFCVVQGPTPWNLLIQSNLRLHLLKRHKMALFQNCIQKLRPPQKSTTDVNGLRRSVYVGCGSPRGRWDSTKQLEQSPTAMGQYRPVQVQVHIPRSCH